MSARRSPATHGLVPRNSIRVGGAGAVAAASPGRQILALHMGTQKKAETLDSLGGSSFSGSHLAVSQMVAEDSIE